MQEIISELNEGNYDKFDTKKGIVENFGDIDFSRPVSNQYWLESNLKSMKYQETMMLFGNYDFDEISSITNLINKKLNLIIY